MIFLEELLASSPFEFSALLFIGSAVALGFLLGKATHWIKLTAIVGYIIAGVVIGPVLGIVDLSPVMRGFIVDFTLAFVAFIIGVGFTKKFIKRTGKVVGIVTIVQSMLTFFVVALAILVVGIISPDIDTKLAIGLAIIFGVLGLATAPAGTIAALHECRARGSLNRIIMGIVGLDDALAVLVFVIGLAAVKILLGGHLTLSLMFESMFIEILGAIALGVLIGIALAFVFRFFKDREEMFIASVGAIMVCAGLAELIGASVIMACMVMGMVFVNIRPREGRVIHGSIEGLIPVVFIVFFVTAGLDLNPLLLFELSVFGGVYVLARFFGKYIGAYLGCFLAKTSEKVKKYMGFTLLSQAGVAIGLALLVSHELMDVPGGERLGIIAITVITATTIAFEIAGPIGIKFAVNKVQGPPRTEEERIIARLSKTADEVDIFNYEVEEDICVYTECAEEDFVYDKSRDTLIVTEEEKK